MTDKTAAAAPHIPETAFDSSQTPAQARDPQTGQYISMNLGYEPHPEDAEELTGDRGDDPTADSARVPKSQVTESVVTEDEAPESTEPEAEPKAEETEVEESKVEETKDEVTKDEDTKDEQRIPKKRFNEVNERRKTAEARVAQLEKKLEALTKAEEGTYDLKTAEREYIDLVLDGKTDEAIAKREEIDQAKLAQYKKAALQQTLEESKTDVLQTTMQAISIEAAQNYAEFDPAEGNEAFREDLVDQVEAFFVGYQNRGKGAIEALEQAIADVVKLNDLQRLGAKPETRRGPRKTAVEKTEKARQQPPLPTAKAGRPADDAGTIASIEADRLTDKELDVLVRESPEEYARLRGDVL